jgi:hypothetical protein
MTAKLLSFTDYEIVTKMTNTGNIAATQVADTVNTL